MILAFAFLVSLPPVIPDNSDSLSMIREANVLIALGQEGAIAKLQGEASNESSRGLWLYWVVRTAFTSTMPGGVFNAPNLGLIDPEPPARRELWPSYPVMMVDGWPVNFFEGAHWDSGCCPGFEFNMSTEQNSWRIRTKPIVPPDDPFATYQNIGKPSWTHVVPKASQATLNLKGPHWEKEKALAGILWLVRDVFEPVDEAHIDSVDPANYERFHRAFLNLHAHWDVKTERYMK